MPEIKRKLGNDPKPEKVKEPRLKKLKVDFSKFVDAIIDGQWTVPANGYVIFERTLNGRTAFHEGTVFNYNVISGSVSIWDDTRGQFFGFELKNPPRIIKARLVTSGSR